MRYLSLYNNIIGYNNYSETIILIVLVMDQVGPRVSTSGLDPNLTLTNCQEIDCDYPKDLKNRKNELFKLV